MTHYQTLYIFRRFIVICSLIKFLNKNWMTNNLLQYSSLRTALRIWRSGWASPDDPLEADLLSSSSWRLSATGVPIFLPLAAVSCNPDGPASSLHRLMQDGRDCVRTMVLAAAEVATGVCFGCSGCLAVRVLGARLGLAAPSGVLPEN